MNSNSTLTSVTDDKPIVYTRSAVIFALVFCIGFIIIGVIGNIATIVALLRHRKLRVAPTTIFILSLSVTDFIFCIFNLPITAVRYANQKWILGDTLCMLFPFFFYRPNFSVVPMRKPSP